jgi:hypothetical protein
MIESTVRITEVVAMIEKNVQVTKVQRNVVEINMTPHPPRYRTESAKKTIVGTLSSRRTANHPY